MIRPSALGDVCRTAPVLVSLRRRFPNAHIDWLVQEEFAGAIEAHPDLNGVIRFPRKAFAGWWRHPKTAVAVRDWLRDLRRQRYDMVVDCQGLLRSGLFAHATGAARRIGYANARELGWLGLNERHRIPRQMHAVDRMLGLIEAAGVPPIGEMRLHAGEGDVADARALTGDAPYWVIAPTSRWPGKQWPDARYRELVERLLEDESVNRVVLVGSTSERDQCPQTLALAGDRDDVIDLLGKTSVGALLGVIEGAGLVIANDSAALHMAVGCGKPIVALFGPTDVSLVGPFGQDAQVLQHLDGDTKFDHKDFRYGASLMNRITVDEVFDFALRTANQDGATRDASVKAHEKVRSA